MKDDEYLSQQLNRPRTPKDLEAKIRANWLEQTIYHRHNSATKYLLIAASVIGVVVATFFVSQATRAPDLVQVAIEDINNDTNKHVGITLPFEMLIKQSKINMPPSSMPVVIAKRCNLDGNETLHIQVAGENHGAVHMFIKKGDFTLAVANASQGEVTYRAWGLIKPRNELSVLVLYSKDMNPASVDALIKTMFFA